ncbi:hypothetical protein FFLO_05282 [Filobasidium floriforme]|uniref:Uncharacterized protein n=1 Tax=Filobasidium floriforme TaxID=5210 RepID=A0A8K0NRH6_9TREE|nr:hypothetical protein FFLO_05282 [Filobasidium floriforme]
MFALRQSIRLSRSTQHLVRPCVNLAPTFSQRGFKSTPQARADLSDMAEAFAKSPLLDIMKKSPGAVAALKEAGEIAKKKGVDMTSPPSKMTMMSLAFDSEFRGAIEKLMTELKNAGVDVTPENLQNMMGSIGEPGQAGDDVGGRKK